MAEENKSCAFRTSIGGQALIEGILMRGPEKQAIVVRDQNGELVKRWRSCGSSRTGTPSWAGP